MARIAWFAPAAAALLLCGCSIIDHEPYREVTYFDITPSVQDRINGAKTSSITVTPSIQFSDRMLVRIGPDQMKFDEYSRWLGSPETLLRRYFESVYSIDPSAPALNVRVVRFEMSKEAQTSSCELQVELVPAQGGTGKDVNFKAEATIKSPGTNSGDFAAAMNDAVDKVSAQIAVELKKARQQP